MPPTVSVAMITYNHAAFIRQAVESVLAQQTPFEIEILIGEDASTDETGVILESLQAEHPGRLTVLHRRPNLGMMRNFFDVLLRARGTYIALLEGDDYWTDPLKLRRQVEFLEAHPEAAVCHHAALRRNESSGVESPFHDSPPPSHSTLEVLLRENPIATCTAMYRGGLVRDIPPEVLECQAADWPCHLLHARHGAIAFLPETMAVYRVHAGGVWSQQDPIQDRLRRIATARRLAPLLAPREQRILARTIERLTNDAAEVHLQHGDLAAARRLVEQEGTPVAGLRRLECFYAALAAEEHGRRLPALGSLARAAVTGFGRTRIRPRDLLIAAGRIAFPKMYSALRSQVRRASEPRPASPAPGADRGSLRG